MTKSTKWFLGIVLVLAFLSIVFIGLMSLVFSGMSDRTETVTVGSGEKIGVVELSGVIVSSTDIVRQIKKYREKSSIRGILLRVDSPGGGVVPSQEIYEEVKKTRDGGKPVVISMGSLAASGGYYVACGGSRIVANRGTLTGSIGVISEFLQVSEALDKIGVGVKTVKSGKLKDAGNPTRKMTEADEKYFQALMDDVHRQFITVVALERRFSKTQMDAIADGRVFTGEQAVRMGIVDTIGTYEDALKITAGLAGISGEPGIVREQKRKNFLDLFFGDVSETITDLKQTVLDRPMFSYRFLGPY